MDVCNVSDNHFLVSSYMLLLVVCSLVCTKHIFKLIPFRLFRLCRQVVTGPDGQPGYAECRNLARYLASLDAWRGYVTDAEAETIQSLWLQLSDADREKVAPSRRFQDRLTTGRFKRPKTERLSGVVPGLDSVRR